MGSDLVVERQFWEGEPPFAERGEPGKPGEVTKKELKEAEEKAAKATEESEERSIKRLFYIDASEYPGIDPTGSLECGEALSELFKLAAEQDRAVYVPKGTYLVKGVNIPPGLNCFGDGSENTVFTPPVEWVGGMFGTGEAVASDVIFEGVKWDGNQQNRTKSMGAALLKAYKAERWTLRNCKIVNGTSYGLGWEGYPGDESPTHQYISTDLIMENCQLEDNGYYGGTLGVRGSGTSTSSDNIDIKSSKRVVMINVYSVGASDKGFNPRCQSGTYINCIAEENAQGFDLNSHRKGPAEEETGPNNDSYHTVIGGKSRKNAGSGLAVSATTGISNTYATIIGFAAYENGGSGLGQNAPAAGSKTFLSVHGGYYNNNTANGISTPGAYLAVMGATCYENGEDGILAEKTLKTKIVGASCDKNKGEAGIRLKEPVGSVACNGNFCNENIRGIYGTNVIGGSILGNTCESNTGTGIVCDGTTNKVNATGNTLFGNTTPITMPTGTSGALNVATPNTTPLEEPPTLASAETITFQSICNFIVLTGVAEVKKITAAGLDRTVTIRFNSTAKLIDGENLKLAGNVEGAANRIVTLKCDGKNWFQTTPPVST